jgi:hypothetical protein
MKQQSITSLPPAPEQERRQRLIKYSITMGVRLLCLAALPFVQGGWMFVVAAGAIFLPYIAVIIANAGSLPSQGVIERPSGVVVSQRPTIVDDSVPPRPADQA